MPTNLEESTAADVHRSALSTGQNLWPGPKAYRPSTTSLQSVQFAADEGNCASADELLPATEPSLETTSDTHCLRRSAATAKTAASSSCPKRRAKENVASPVSDATLKYNRSHVEMVRNQRGRATRRKKRLLGSKTTKRRRFRAVIAPVGQSPITAPPSRA